MTKVIEENVKECLGVSSLLSLSHFDFNLLPPSIEKTIALVESSCTVNLDCIVHESDNV